MQKPQQMMVFQAKLGKMMTNAVICDEWLRGKYFTISHLHSRPWTKKVFARFAGNGGHGTISCSPPQPYFHDCFLEHLWYKSKHRPTGNFGLSTWGLVISWYENHFLIANFGGLLFFPFNNPGCGFSNFTRIPVYRLIRTLWIVKTSRLSKNLLAGATK